MATGPDYLTVKQAAQESELFHARMACRLILQCAGPNFGSARLRWASMLSSDIQFGRAVYHAAESAVYRRRAERADRAFANKHRLRGPAFNYIHLDDEPRALDELPF